MFVNTPSGRIACRTFGDNKSKPVVFIHGFPFDKSMWESQGELLAKDHFVVTFDNPGHGESEVGSGQYLVEFIVDDLFAVMDHFGLKKAVICGLSIGGYTAMRAIEREPERFAGLILCNTKSAPDTNAAKLNRANQIRMIRFGRKKQFVEDNAKALLAPESFERNRDAFNKIIATMNSTDEKALIGTLIALAARMDMTESLGKISVPTLIITGEKDKVATQADAELMHSKIGNSKLAIIRGAGHLSNLENSAEFNSALVSFLRESNF